LAQGHDDAVSASSTRVISSGFQADQRASIRADASRWLPSRSFPGTWLAGLPPSTFGADRADRADRAIRYPSPL